MKKIFTSIAAIALATLAGCATPPDRIKAIPSSAPCTGADQAQLERLSALQEKKARNDALGVLVIGLPVASMGSEDHKQEIAVLKGRCGS